MSIAQKQKCNQKIFSEVVESLFSSFLMESEQCQKIDFIFDVYRDKSIKNVERFDARGAALATAFKSILGKSLAVFYQRIKVQDGVYLFHVQRAEEAVLQIKISE